MVERAATQGSLSVEDYLEMEKTATVRREYVAGEVYAMTGASRRHNRIAGNGTGVWPTRREKAHAAFTWRPSSFASRTSSTTRT